MAAHSGPKINRDELKVLVDLSNPKSYPVNGLEVDVLIVAGGGSGGADDEAGGGGGAGGMIEQHNLTLSNTDYTIVVGAGGTAVSNPSAGNNGSDSSAFSLTAIGGGGGGGHEELGAQYAAKSGGSGGGSASHDGEPNPLPAGGAALQPGSASGGYGNAGGDMAYPGNDIGAGGGGAGNVGQSITSDAADLRNGGNGGRGRVSRLNFTRTWYAGGGGGSWRNSNPEGNGGIGGGGDGSNGTGQSGTANTGGGGGSGIGTSGAGGSGIVIVRYKGAQKATGGDNIYFKSGHTVHEFTTTGSQTFSVGSAAGSMGTIRKGAELKNNLQFVSGAQEYTSFDGVDDILDMGELTDNIFVNNSGQGTIMMWIRNSSSSRQTLASGYVTGDNRWDFEIISNTLQGGFHADGFLAGSTTISSNTWTHVCMIVSNNTQYFYVNGTIDTSKTIAKNLQSGINLSIGNRLSGNKFPFSGDISKLKVFNRALTARQVRRNFNAQRGRFGT